MDRHDPNLPEDLRDVASRLTEARHQPTALEMDALQQRASSRLVAREGKRQGRVRVALRAKAAAILTGALLATTGASAVIAATSIGGGDTGSFSRMTYTHPGDAADCQYKDSYSKSFTGTSGGGSSNATLTVTYTCKTRTVCITSTKDISNYTWAGKSKVDLKYATKKICITWPSGSSTVTVTFKSGTTSQTFTFTIPKT